MTKSNVLFKFLADTKMIFDKNEIVFWLDAGTLLGAIRDNNLIPWDTDIDLSCWKTEDDYQLKKKLQKDFIKLGYEVILSDHWIRIYLKEYVNLALDINFHTIEGGDALTPSSSLSKALIKKRAIAINHLIKYLYTDRLLVVHYSKVAKLAILIPFKIVDVLFKLLPPKTKNKFLEILVNIRKKITKHKSEYVQLEYFSKFKEIDVFGGTYLIPMNPEKYLEMRYGNNWRKPIEKWDTFTQDNTVR